MKEQLEIMLKELHLASFRQMYEPIASDAIDKKLSYEQYLFELTESEIFTRRENKVKRLLKESKLPTSKTRDTFDFSLVAKKAKAKYELLRSGNFLNKAENVLLFGNPGSGKTHFVCALAREMIEMRKKVLFFTCNTLVQNLLIAKKELRINNYLKKLSRIDLIIIDDIGYVQQNRAEMEVLFTFLADRYEAGSIMITSNLPFSKWEQIFKDPMTTIAAIDRLVHHSVIVELNNESYRKKAAKIDKDIEKV